MGNFLNLLQKDEVLRKVEGSLKKGWEIPTLEETMIILLSKINHYIIRGLAFDWFKSFRDRTQYATTNHERSEIQTIKHGAPRHSILGPLSFLIYINDLSWSINNPKIHHLCDDTNLLYSSSSLKDINKKSLDLSNLVQWLLANEIALNVNKADIVFSWSPRKQFTKKMNFHIGGQKIRQKTCTKYLGVLIDEHLFFKDHITM